MAILMESVISSHEAKTKFGALLARVEDGEELVITRHDVPIARMIPEGRERREDMAGWIAAMKERRKARKLNVDGLSHLSIRELIEDGRK